MTTTPLQSQHVTIALLHAFTLPALTFCPATAAGVGKGDTKNELTGEFARQLVTPSVYHLRPWLVQHDTSAIRVCEKSAAIAPGSAGCQPAPVAPDARASTDARPRWRAGWQPAVPRLFTDPTSAMMTFAGSVKSRWVPLGASHAPKTIHEPSRPSLLGVSLSRDLPTIRRQVVDSQAGGAITAADRACRPRASSP